MNAHNQVEENSADTNTVNQTDTGTTIEAIIAMVSYLQSEIQPHNSIAAYFLDMCSFSLQNPDLILERYPRLLHRRV